MAKRSKPRKTMHTIMIKHVHPLTEEEFFERLFWKNPTLVKPALRICKMIASGEFNEKTRDEIQKELSITFAQYYHILRCLKAFGLIRREWGQYKPSREFIKRLERYAEFAARILFGEEEIVDFEK